MVDHAYADRDIAAWYDLLNPWAGADDFYLGLVMDAASVLDVGCGTGLILDRARERGHTGRLAGVDPAPGMLEQARRRRPDVEWTETTMADAPGSPGWRGGFELAVMTGHAFQVLLTDEEVHATLTAVHDALAPGGRFAFETRNPAARAWEQWTPEHATEVTNDAGVTARVTHQVLSVEDGIVDLTETFSGAPWPEPEVSRARLRFLDRAGLDARLEAAGLTVVERYGWWDRSPLAADSREIITLAERPA